tara:strand:- start:11686 stop:13275 length:1590 start_codon:yes stop_codon:yes gene_type:complete
MKKTKIIGFCSSHDSAYGVLEDGIPTIHNELERFTRIKDDAGDAMDFMFQTYDDADTGDYYTHCMGSKMSGKYKASFDKCKELSKEWIRPGHHQSHAANAFYSSEFEEALIVTMDGGGGDFSVIDDEYRRTCFTVWDGKDNKITELEIWPETKLHLGGIWSFCTRKIFGLSHKSPSQQGTVMGMAALGDASKYIEYFKYIHVDNDGQKLPDEWKTLADLAKQSEQEMFNIAAALQQGTEDVLRTIFDRLVEEHKPKNICLSGGVSLNCVFTGKLFDWYPGINVYCDPIPYDAGLALGSARYIYHDVLDNPRIYNNVQNATPYLGRNYSEQEIADAVENMWQKNKDDMIIFFQNDDFIIDEMMNEKIISVYGGGSESGRRALGNRSILADPRSLKNKDIVNEKVKHRQWFRPFAPSILREHVKDWFEHDIDSPYMSFCLKWKEGMAEKVPAVVHFDNSARLQTVKKEDNEWYHSFITKFYEKTGIPLVLNTSFNDREPIVETPEHAVSTFWSTDIDYLYFREIGLVISKR